MPYCCVPGCLSRARKCSGISLHELPSNQEQREKWIQAIARKDWNPDLSSGRFAVCSEHFVPSDFSVSTTRRKLLPSAVPTVFKRIPKFLKPAKRGKRKTKQFVDSVLSPVPVNGDSDLPPSTDPTTISKSDLDSVQQSVRKPFDQSSVTEIILPSPVPECSEDNIVSPSQKCFNYQITMMQGPDGTVKYDGHPERNGLVATPVAVKGNSVQSLKIVSRKLTSKTRFHKCTQADFRIFQSPEITYWKRRFRIMHRKLEKLREEAKTYRKELKVFKNEPYFKNIIKMKEESERSEPLAIFLLDQVHNYPLPVPRWTRTTLRQSIGLRDTSPEAYEHLRTHKLLKLPGHATLSKYKEEIETVVR